MGLITSILKRTETRVVENKVRVHTKALKSRSDVQLFQDFVEIEAKLKAGKPTTREERRKYRHALKKLRERGLVGQVTEET